MFDEFRRDAKRLAKERGLTYAKIADEAGICENTIKCFMCGANDSRRVAEKIANVLEMSILYRDGEFFAIADHENNGA